MMHIGDLVSVYAAILSSILAFVQMSEWKRRKSFLVVEVRESWWGEDDPFWQIAISNRANKSVQMNFVAVARFSPKRHWRRGLVYESEMSIKEYDDREPNEIGEPLDRRILEPGKTIYAIIRKAEIQEINKGFGTVLPPPGIRKYGLSIEHSQSDKPIIKLIRVSKTLAQNVTSAEIEKSKSYLCSLSSESSSASESLTHSASSSSSDVDTRA